MPKLYLKIVFSGISIQQSKIDTAFQFGIAVQLQYCDNWQFRINNAA